MVPGAFWSRLSEKLSPNGDSSEWESNGASEDMQQFARSAVCSDIGTAQA